MHGSRGGESRVAGDAHDVHLEGGEAGLDRPPDAAVAEEEHATIREAGPEREGPVTRRLCAGEVVETALAGQDEGQGQLGRRGLVDARGVRVGVSGRQDLADPVVADGLALDQTSGDSLEVAQARFRREVVGDDEIDVVTRGWSREVPRDHAHVVSRRERAEECVF